MHVEKRDNRNNKTWKGELAALPSKSFFKIFILKMCEWCQCTITISHINVRQRHTIECIVLQVV